MPLRRLVPCVAAALAGLALAGVFAGPGWAQVNWDAWKPKDNGPTTYPAILIEAGALAPLVDSGGVVVLDARSRAAWEGGHIPGAIPVPARDLPDDPAAARAALAAAGVSSRGTAVCYDDAADPAASGRIFWLLELAGHPDVRVLNGGLEAWRAAGATTRETAPVAPGRFEAAVDTSRIASFEYLLERFGRPACVVLDPRSPDTWAEGHVPHSLPFPLETLRGGDGRLLDGPAMRTLFTEWGPRPREFVDLSGELIVCAPDPAVPLPVHPYLAARIAGLTRVRVYPGGFAGWSAREEAPIVRIVGAEEVRAMLRKSWGGAIRPYPPPDLLLFDLRGWREYAMLGHLPGALYLPAHEFARDLDAVVGDYWPGVDRARTPLLVYCYGPTCTRSRNCSTIAATMGFRRLFWFKDGPDAWRALGERLEVAPPGS